MWDLPGPGLEPMSPALAGRFLTTVPPGKPQVLLIKSTNKSQIKEKATKHNQPEVIRLSVATCPISPDQQNTSLMEAFS